jgi:hypothetical protein
MAKSWTQIKSDKNAYAHKKLKLRGEAERSGSGEGGFGGSPPKTI